MILLKVSGVSRQAQGNYFLKDISFSQRKLQKIAIAGETGSGKSTLLKIIAGLVQPDEGEVVLEDEKVKGPDETLVPGHPSILYLTQEFDLPKSLRVSQVMSYSNKLTGRRADVLYDVCRIDHLLERRTDELSGGEKQRIALARLLTASPKLLLLDEPFSNLDMIQKNTLKSVINSIFRRLKITCILVSHDPLDSLSWADHIIVMKEGRVIQCGTPEIIYRQPIDEYTAGLFGKFNSVNENCGRALVKTFKLDCDEKNIFIRPEKFKLVRKGAKSVKGRVEQVNFFGSHYEIEVLLADTTVTVRVTSTKNKPGDTVHVSLIR